MTDAVTDSHWPRETIRNAGNAGVIDMVHVYNIDDDRPNDVRLLVAKQDIKNMLWLHETRGYHDVEELRNIDTIRAQYEAGQFISTPKRHRSTAAPKAAQPKEATAAVVEISSRRSRINERLWNIAAGFVIAGGIALGFIAFMVVIIGVAALM